MLTGFPPDFCDAAGEVLKGGVGGGGARAGCCAKETRAGARGWPTAHLRVVIALVFLLQLRASGGKQRLRCRGSAGRTRAARASALWGLRTNSADGVRCSHTMAPLMARTLVVESSCAADLLDLQPMARSWRREEQRRWQACPDLVKSQRGTQAGERTFGAGDLEHTALPAGTPVLVTLLRAVLARALAPGQTELDARAAPHRRSRSRRSSQQRSGLAAGPCRPRT